VLKDDEKETPQQRASKKASMISVDNDKENSNPKKVEKIPEGQVLMSGQKLKELEKLQKENEAIIKQQEEQEQQNEILQNELQERETALEAENR